MNKEKSKILFSAYSLDVGGIEKSLITLINKLDILGYNISLVLEKKQGLFLKDISKNIEIIEYKPSTNKNFFSRKIINLIKRLKFIVKYKNKFDFSACFATYSLSSSFTSRVASKNTALWCHADYLTVFNNNKHDMKKFFESVKYNKFKKIVFVSKEGKESFINLFPKMAKKTIVCNNLIDSNMIKKMSEEKIDIEYNNNCITFLNVGRHDEKQKKLSRIIYASKLLKSDNLKFRVLLIGEGKDTEYYKKMVKEDELDNYIIFLGAQKNPYPFFKISDCVILSSDYEGYPVVFLESFVLNKPIITTKVSDYEDIKDKFGYVTEKDALDIYDKMKLFINNGFEIKEKFDSDQFNENIIEKIKDIIER